MTTYTNPFCAAAVRERRIINDHYAQAEKADEARAGGWAATHLSDTSLLAPYSRGLRSLRVVRNVSRRRQQTEEKQ